MSAAGTSGQLGVSVEAARAGSPAALAALYREHGTALYRLAYRLTGTPQDAEDVVHEEIEGYSHAEVGELLGISTGASRVRLNRAMRLLRKTLEDGR